MRRDAGFSLVETLVSTLVLLVVSSAVFALMAPTSAVSVTQPHFADVQQRLRVAAAAIEDDLAHAGATPRGGAASGGLLDYRAAVLPYRWGSAGADPPGTFRADVLTAAYLAGTAAHSRIDRVGGGAGPAIVALSPGCGTGRSNPRCGFEPGMRVLLHEPSPLGRSAVGNVIDVLDHALVIVPSEPLAFEYIGAFVTELRSRTYYLRRDALTRTAELMRFDGVQTDMPVVEDVVGFELAYWGTATGPELIAPEVRRTSYGPAPPAVGEPSGAAWPAGENCTFAVVDGAHVPRLGSLVADATGLAPLAGSVLTDGPWCPDPFAADRFDADLLRIRRVEVRVRVQVSVPWLRGQITSLFAFPGRARPAMQVPDATIAFSVSPRNLNLVREW